MPYHTMQHGKANHAWHDTVRHGTARVHTFRFIVPCRIVLCWTGPELQCERNIKDNNWKPQADQLPPVIPPSGLSLQRHWYLYKKIREFCPDHLKDTTCPQPGGPSIDPSPSLSPSATPSCSPTPPTLITTTTTTTTTTTATTTDSEEAPAKRARLCGHC